VKFWENPEFIRHVRADLRGPRAITMATVTLVICALVGLSCWSGSKDLNEFFGFFHFWLVGIQFTVLGLWCASACGHAISRERDLKTFDFLRTTRLTAGELAVGKILGAPIMAYFVTACSLPISIIAGILGGISAATLAGIYLLLIVFALFSSVVGLWVSLLVEKSNAAAAVALIMLATGMGFSFLRSPFPGFSAMSVFPAIFWLYGVGSDLLRFQPTIFGFGASFLALTILLYATFGAWLMVMTVRNLKKDRDEMRLLSHWQAIGLIAFLNVLFYAFLDPKRLVQAESFGALTPWETAMITVVLNGSALFLVGTAIIGSRERLKIWWRKREAAEAGYLSGDGFAWPWLVIGAVVGYALLAAEAFGMSTGSLSWHDWKLGFSAVLFLDFLIFIIRDITFLQWCSLTRMKRPIFKGFLYLCLYYVAVAIISTVVAVASHDAGSAVLGLFSPWQVMASQQTGLAHIQASYVGMGLQAIVSGFLVTLIGRRLSRPAALVPATSS
jgi:hypothetical protein